MNPQNYELSYELNRVHLQDQMREAAEHQRQMHNHEQDTVAHHAALNTLGRQMVKIGEWLQQQ